MTRLSCKHPDGFIRSFCTDCWVNFLRCPRCMPLRYICPTCQERARSRYSASFNGATINLTPFRLRRALNSKAAYDRNPERKRARERERYLRKKALHAG